MNCWQVERNVFPHPKVREIFDRAFVIADIFVVDRDPEISKRNAKLAMDLVETTAQPTYAVIDPKTNKVVHQWGYRLGFAGDPPSFGEELEEGLRQLGH